MRNASKVGLEVLQIVVGNALSAFAIACFALPYGMVVSGLAGVGRMTNHYFGLSVSGTVLVINVILFVIGTAALICPVPFERKFIADTVIAIGAGVVLWLGTFQNRELRKPCGIVMLLCYAAYFAYLCVM